MSKAAKIIINMINNKKEDYETLLSELTESDTPDIELAGKYRYYIMCLTELTRQLSNTWSISKEESIWNLLKQNHLKHDTEFIFKDNSSFVVSKDDECVLEEDCIRLLDRDMWRDEKVMFTLRVINCDNVLMVRTVEEK